MNVIKHTISLCPTCYREIVATIYVDGAVKMDKVCPVHGKSTGIVEVDPAFYLWCMSHPSEIYDGHLVDVTTRCNLDCKYCYYEKGDTYIPDYEIVNECRVNRGPYILTGGEPTLRQDLPEILRQVREGGQVHFLTNGTGFLDRKYLRECADSASMVRGFNCIGLSFHAEQPRFDDIMENLKLEGVNPNCCFFVIDDLEQIPAIISFAETNRGMFDDIRIKIASDVWAQDSTNKIFASQVIDYFKSLPGELVNYGKGKTSFMPIKYNGIPYLIVSWLDASNVDLLDISCPPTYRARNGEVTDFVKAMLINQGMMQGWLKGTRCKL